MELAGRLTLIGIQLLGLVISVLLVAVTFSNPVQVEERLRQFAIEEVERAAQEVWSNRTVGQGEGSKSEKLMALSDRLGMDAQVLDTQRKEVVPAILALAKSESCKENCEFWVLASQLTNLAMVERAAQIRVGQSTLGDLLVERYEMSVQGLLTDLRRFGLVNVVVLSLMLGLVVFRNHLNWRFTAFSVALTGYTAWAAYGYVYNQNWALGRVDIHCRPPVSVQNCSVPGKRAQEQPAISSSLNAEMGNFGETPAGRGGFCLCHPGCSLPMITLLRSHQGASGKIRLARVGDNECQHDLAILFQDWASPGYQAAMIFFALLFFDWLFLRGNVTQAISNFIASALSGQSRTGEMRSVK